jgi:glycosyltransferase involved in cell wall biosynthesis
MLAAFKELGCDVDLVTGYSEERKKCIAKIKENIKQDKKYDFVYSESSTMPTILTDPHHLPLHPFLDWQFFSFCKKNNIPIGLFYRDIYWLFDSYGAGLNPIKTAVAKLAYRFDLWVYQKTLAKLYLPSKEMGAYVPHVDSSHFSALPPGHTSPPVSMQTAPNLNNRPLKLFYVGGMSSHYQMHELFKAARSLPNIELKICTRESEWQSVKHEYPELTANIQIVHLSGTEMEAQLQACDIAVLFVKPQEYREFASPVKLYEYLGFQKPILASEGTLAGRFVKEKGVGWALPYEVDSVSGLLKKLIKNPELFGPVYEKLQQVAPQHSWQARAKQVIKDLS